MESKQLALVEGTPCAKPEHEEFARELATHGVAMVAYRRAYPHIKDSSAKSNAWLVARHPDVVRRVAEFQKARREQLLRDTADLEALVANLAVGKAAELVDEDGRPIPIEQLPAHVKAALVGLEIEITTDAEGRSVQRYKAKFPNPLDAARLLAQLRGALIDRKDITSAGHPIAAVVAPEALPADLERELRRRLLPGSLEDPIDVDVEGRENNDDLV